MNAQLQEYYSFLINLYHERLFHSSLKTLFSIVLVVTHGLKFLAFCQGVPRGLASLAQQYWTKI
jgi:hypothetical protein